MTVRLTFVQTASRLVFFWNSSAAPFRASAACAMAVVLSVGGGLGGRLGSVMVGLLGE